jgi:hypothetical protein
MGLFEQDAKRTRDVLLVEADDELVADKDDRHAHLPGPLYHLLALLEVVRDIVLGIRDVMLLEKLFAHLTKVAGRGAVDGDGLHSEKSIALPSYPQKLGAGCENRTRVYCLGSSRSTTEPIPPCPYA